MGKDLGMKGLGKKLTREDVIMAVKNGKPLDGANLEGVDLSRADLKEVSLVEANLKNCNLERANLEHAHLYKANFQGSNLFNANLKFSNIKEADFQGANLLEVKLEGAKLAGLKYGSKGIIANEQEAKALDGKGFKLEAKEKYREAEEIYRVLRVRLTELGIFDEAADLFYREMVMRRKQQPLFSYKRLSSKITDVLCGYGEKTARVISSAALFVIFNGIVFYLCGIKYGNEILRYQPNQPIVDSIKDLGLCIYYSVVTLTTLGYGDITPLGISKIFAGVEAFIGAFMMALFVLVFGRKMMR